MHFDLLELVYKLQVHDSEWQERGQARLPNLEMPDCSLGFTLKVFPAKT
jgi:hypothetical protein